MQLLIALRNFVVALGYQSHNCYSMLLPILRRGIDINSPDELNLLEDSMLVRLPLCVCVCVCVCVYFSWLLYSYMFAKCYCHNPAVVGSHYFSCSCDGASTISILSMSSGNHGKKF